MKKTIIKILAVLSLFVLSGCVKMRLTLDVNSSGNVKTGATVLVREDMLEIGGSALTDQVEAMIKQLQEEYPEARVSAVQETEGETNYSGITVSNIQKDDFKAELEDGQIVLRIPVNSLASEATAAFGDLIGSYTSLKEYGTEITLTVNMPNKADSNAGTVNGRTVTIDLMDLPAGTEEIVISCRQGLSPAAMLGIAAAIAALAGGGYWFLHRKNEGREEL